MNSLEFYTLVRQKGLIIDDVEAEIADNEAETIFSDTELATHILCVLELNRREVFKAWYGAEWVKELEHAEAHYILERIDYCISYIINKLSTENSAKAKTEIVES